MDVLYIDESGDPGRYDINDITIQNSTKHFTLAGIIVQDRMIGPLNTHVQNLIRQYFDTASLDGKFKLHYYPLAKGRPPYDQLSPKERKCLVDDIFELIRTSQCKLLSATINLEKYFKKDYALENPKAYAMLLMLERFQDFLNMNGSDGSVVYERFNKRERRKIKRAVTALHERLEIKHYKEIDGMLGDIRNGDPTKEHILELADFFAYVTFTKYESKCTKHDKWYSIKEKYFMLDAGYYTAGNILR